jgi:hypothetical protein
MVWLAIQNAGSNPTAQTSVATDQQLTKFESKPVVTVGSTDQFISVPIEIEDPDVIVVWAYEILSVSQSPTPNPSSLPFNQRSHP